jgi:hypothetical protein
MMTIKKLLTGLLATSLLLSAAPSFADPKKMSGNEVYQNTKDFRFQSLGSLKGNKRIMIPMIEFRIQNQGAQTATSQKSGGFGSSAGTATAHATAEVTVALEPALARELATQVHKDLVARFTAAGWEVVDINDYKGTRAYRGLNFEGESKLGVGLKAENRRGIQGLNNSGAGGGGFFVATADGTDFIKPKLGLHYNAVRGISKEANAIVLIPAYTINTMTFDKETGGSNWGGRARATASISAEPVASLAGAHFEFTTPKGKLANIYSPILKTWGNDYIGELVEESKVSPGIANTIGTIGGALGLANTQRGRTNYVLVPDEAALKQQTFRMTESVNDIVARATGFYVKK